MRSVKLWLRGKQDEEVVLLLETEVVVSASPHIRQGVTTERIMWMVVISLLPAVFASITFFGGRALLIILCSVFSAVLTEAAVEILLKRPVTVKDGSAAVTGLLLALTLPPTVPLILPVLGAAFAIAIGKQIFGGLGFNPLNPALIGRAFLLASWPDLMTTWKWPAASLTWLESQADAVAGATVLGLIKEGTTVQLPFLQMFLGNMSGSLGETSALALLVGGLFLLAYQIIDWRIPVGYLGTVILMALLVGENPLLQLLAGGLILGAFFMATDYVTTPVTPKGRLIFGIGCGLLTMLIRKYGGFPEGVGYSILLMNVATPLLDRWTIPKRFGEVKANG
ncbi:MAG: RnfABCDGE type electron transport complex subunit D [Firmicutes bacterium]|nr:RnfABCDGE type electron transport complex subunit D [Bacillota bacterium]